MLFHKNRQLGLIPLPVFYAVFMLFIILRVSARAHTRDLSFLMAKKPRKPSKIKGLTKLDRGGVESNLAGVLLQYG